MIQIFITGGTFDKSYNYKNGNLFFKKTHIPEMLKRSKSQLKVQIKTLMMIDSLEMTKTDIKKIIFNCKNSTSNKIIITHGTDTMVNTAKFIAKEKIDKTIILTGAMIPYAFGSSSWNRSMFVNFPHCPLTLCIQLHVNMFNRSLERY